LLKLKQERIEALEQQMENDGARRETKTEHRTPDADSSERSNSMGLLQWLFG